MELAAARVRVMSVAEIARGLEDRFGLLRGGPRDAPERHQTLRGVVDWSWNLLDPAGQAAMRALSVFPAGSPRTPRGGCSADGDASDVARSSGTLVDQSLLQVSDTHGHAVPDAGDGAGVQHGAPGGGRRDRSGGRRVPGLGARLRGGAPRCGLRGRPLRAVERIRAEQDNLAEALRYGLAKADGGTVAATSAVLGACGSSSPTSSA